MAGYSLGGADLLRRAMGKKIQAAMDAERPKFIAGAAGKRRRCAKTAEEVWALLDKFANYGFNKSHAAAYGAGQLSDRLAEGEPPGRIHGRGDERDIHLTDKLNVYKREVDRLGIELVPPCVNRSNAVFSVAEGRIVYALGALKNVGRGDAAAGRGARRGGRSATCSTSRRVDLRVGKRALEMLARAGAFDALDANRARVFAGLDALIAHSAALHDERASAQVSLFGEAAQDLPTRGCPIPHPGCQQKSWPRNMPRSASTCRAIRWKTIAGRLPARGSRR
jgi:DNA polymerase-3 subunit alpha